MRRFWFFPLVWAIFGWLYPASLYFQGKIPTWIQAIKGNTTDVYEHQSSLLNLYITFILAGVIFGLFVAIIDFAINRSHDASGNQSAAAFIKALKYGLPFLIICFILRQIAVMVPAYWSMNRRYHAYPPQMEPLNAFAEFAPFITAVIFIGFMTWKTLRYKQAIIRS